MNDRKESVSHKIKKVLTESTVPGTRSLKSLDIEESLHTKLLHESIEDQQSNRGLKTKYAHWFIYILMGQLLIMNLVFILTGCNVLAFGSYVLELYLIGTLAEVFGIILVITKNLFPRWKDTEKTKGNRPYVRPEQQN